VQMACSNSSSGPGIVGITYLTAMFAIENMAQFSGGFLLLDGPTTPQTQGTDLAHNVVCLNQSIITHIFFLIIFLKTTIYTHILLLTIFLLLGGIKWNNSVNKHFSLEQ